MGICGQLRPWHTPPLHCSSGRTTDPSHLRVLETLRDGPRTVTAIVEATGLSQSNVSNHLACLLDCDLVSRERQGRYGLYRLSDERVGQLLELGEELLADVAKGVYLCTRYGEVDGKEQPDRGGGGVAGAVGGGDPPGALACMAGSHRCRRIPRLPQRAAGGPPAPSHLPHAHDGGRAGRRRRR